MRSLREVLTEAIEILVDEAESLGLADSHGAIDDAMIASLKESRDEVDRLLAQIPDSLVAVDTDTSLLAKDIKS